jgi:hypothetical protein
MRIAAIVVVSLSDLCLSIVHRITASLDLHTSYNR